MSRFTLFITLVFLTVVSDVLSHVTFVKRANDLIPTNGNQGTQTPASTPYSVSGRSPQQHNERSRITDRPPELPRDHPIEPQRPPPVQYKEDKPSMWQPLTGKKRKTPMSHDHEASTSGTKDESGYESPQQSPRRAKAKSQIDDWIDDLHQQRRRRRYSQSWEQNRAEDNHVAKGLVTAAAVAGYGVMKTYQAGRRMVSDIRDKCVGACRSIRQRIQRGGVVLNERPRSNIARYRQVNTPRNVVYENQLRAKERLAEIKRNRNQGIHGTRRTPQQSTPAQHHSNDVRNASIDSNDIGKDRKHVTGTKSLDKKIHTENSPINRAGQNDNGSATTRIQRSNSAPPDHKKSRNNSLTRSKSFP